MVGYNPDEELLTTIRHSQLRDTAIAQAAQGLLADARRTATMIGWGREKDEILLAIAVHDARLGHLENARQTVSEIWFDALQVQALVGIAAHLMMVQPNAALAMLVQARQKLAQIANVYERADAEAFINQTETRLQEIAHLHAQVRFFQETITTIAEQAIHHSRPGREAAPSQPTRFGAEVNWEAVRR